MRTGEASVGALSFALAALAVLALCAWAEAQPTIPRICDNWTAINQTTGTQLITGTANKKTYICALNLVTATAQNIALVAGTGTVCATGISGLAGGTTAATGWNFAANGGLTQGTGVGVIMQAVTTADNICLLQSGSGQISGAIAWTQL